MSRRKYPRLGTSHRHERSHKICRVIGCGDRAKTQQFVEYSWFRGDDEAVWICAMRNHTVEQIITAIEEQMRCRKKA